jgi:hypothetical protein
MEGCCSIVNINVMNFYKGIGLFIYIVFKQVVTLLYASLFLFVAILAVITPIISIAIIGGILGFWPVPSW